MSNYEYLGKKEIYKRVQALGYEVPKISDFNYIKYDCIEWMESHELKITVQRSGEWLQVVEKRAHVHPVTLFCDYQAGKYITRYHQGYFISLFAVPKIKRAAVGAVASCPGISPGAVVH